MPKLKFKYADETEIPEGLKEYYAQNDASEWVLEVTGAVDKEKVTEFRDNNIKLKKEISEEKKKVEELAGVLGNNTDPEKAKQWLEEQLKSKGGKNNSEEIEKKVQERLEQVNQNHQKEKQQIESKLQEKDKHVHELVVQQAVSQVAIESGVKKNAIPLVVERARNRITVGEKGQPVVLDENGEPAYAEDGITPASVKGFIQSLKKDYDFLFEQNSGSGAAGGTGKGSGGSGGVNYYKQNPFSKDYLNVTLQGKLRKENPELAEKLERSAKGLPTE